MTTLIHILGADIPHHNQTVLRFFNEVLATALPAEQPRQFWVVNCPPALQQTFNALNIRDFSSKAALAQAVLQLARANRQTRFFFHGQFNLRIWLGMLSGALRPNQVLWHIWGADLYEDRQGLTFRLFYALRRLAQRRVGRVFATQGDLSVFRQRCPQVAGEVLYFPTRLQPLKTASVAQPGEPFTLLVGNSGDASNQHIAALQAIHRSFGPQVRVVVPMGYPDGNERYIAEVEAAGRALFPAENLQVLRQKLAFDAYLDLIARCDLGYFIFDRQQGIGTICLLIQAGVPMVISRKNPFWQDLAAAQLPVLFADDTLNRETIDGARQQLMALSTADIPFFEPAYVAGWSGVIQQLEDQGT